MNTTKTTAASLKIGSIFLHDGAFQRVTFKRKSRRYAGFLAVQFVKHEAEVNGEHLRTHEVNLKAGEVVEVAA